MVYKREFCLDVPYLEDWKTGRLEDFPSQLSASRFLSQAYPIMSATMRNSSAAARQKCLKVNTSV